MISPGSVLRELSAAPWAPTPCATWAPDTWRDHCADSRHMMMAAAGRVRERLRLERLRVKPF